MNNYQQGNFQQQNPQQKQQKQYPEDRRAFTWFGAKSMFMVSLDDDTDYVMFEWREATGERQYNGRKIVAKMSKSEIALLAQGLYSYAFFGDRGFFNFTERYSTNTQKQGTLDLYHKNPNGHTIISLSLYNGRLYLSASKHDGTRLSIGVDTFAYDLHLTLLAFHNYICQNYIYAKAIKKKNSKQQVNQQNIPNNQQSYNTAIPNTQSIPPQNFQHVNNIPNQNTDIDIPWNE